MKKFKDMTAAKKLKMLLIIIGIIFVGINIFWALTSGLPSYGYKARLGENVEYSGTSYSKESGGLVYSVSKQEYLSARGYVQVYNKYSIDIGENTDNGMLISLFIYPQLFGKCEYAVIINDDTEGIDEMFTIDENLEYIAYDENDTATNARQKKLLDENREQIRLRMDGAQNMWKFEENDTIYGLKEFVKNLF